MTPSELRVAGLASDLANLDGNADPRTMSEFLVRAEEMLEKEHRLGVSAGRRAERDGR